MMRGGGERGVLKSTKRNIFGESKKMQKYYFFSKIFLATIFFREKKLKIWL